MSEVKNLIENKDMQLSSLLSKGRHMVGRMSIAFPLFKILFQSMLVISVAATM